VSKKRTQGNKREACLKWFNTAAHVTVLAFAILFALVDHFHTVSTRNRTSAFKDACIFIAHAKGYNCTKHVNLMQKITWHSLMWEVTGANAF